ncbi:hypothetical protein CHS0354_033805 [Potamilus streckersoni]|uniref:Ig-like domain-containing protein n=1 Tax=Potamilus streckersoni TaxID=2493646 RepID=A0AAE0SFD1_9BIVA|nr:hypothetical protein CHS0354_033805 [Potamilus streckersoni]
MDTKAKVAYMDESDHANLDGPDELLFNVSNNTIELDERDSIAISCYADCFPPCQIDWIGSHAETSITSAELKIVNVKREGNYTCRAMNPRKVNITISDTIYVIVQSDV